MDLKNEITKFNLRENGEVDKDDKNGKISEAFKAYTESNPEKRSTYLYEALYSQYSVFDGFSVQWVDGNEDEKKEIRCVKNRLNVAEYDHFEKIPASKTKEQLTKNKNYKQCQRMWSYSINEDKTK